MEASMTGKIAYAAQNCGYRTPERYAARAQFLFDGLALERKRVLEIGCGRGPWALWSALSGASYVLGIEPEIAGSTSGVFAQFQRSRQELGLEEVVEAQAMDALKLNVSEPFDYIISYNVINHFSEDHTRALHQQESRRFYRDVFQHLASLLKPGGVIITADCSRRNLFGDLGMKNPIASSIEWTIHRTPEEWLDVMQEAGFRFMDVRWSYPYPFTWLPMNRLLAYVTTSHFVLRVRKP